MEVISADYVGMLKEADELTNCRKKLGDEIRRLKYVMNDLDIFWDGEANEEFHLTLNEDFAVMETLLFGIKISSNLLKQAVSDYVDTENEINMLIGDV